MKLALLGDIAVFEDGLLNSEYRENFREVSEYLANFDYVVANLEAPITDRKRTLVCKGMHLRTSSKIAELLKYLHVNAVCLSNNHTYDFGKAGIRDTQKTLESNDIAFFGVNGKTLDVNVANEKLKFYGFCCYSTNGAFYTTKLRNNGIVGLTEKTLKKALEDSKECGSFPVLSLHWGDEYSQLPNERQVALVDRLSKVSPFVIYGHHAHVMQGLSQKEGSLAIYNMGNFCFDKCTDPVNEKLVIKQSEVNKESFIASIEVEDGILKAYETKGVRYDDFKMVFIDNRQKIETLSGKIADCKTVEYKKEALDMIKAIKGKNLVKHDLAWLVSKMNYYSVGAKLLSFLNNEKYKRAY